jgi:hypothetical protein
MKSYNVAASILRYRKFDTIPSIKDVKREV